MSAKKLQQNPMTNQIEIKNTSKRAKIFSSYIIAVIVIIVVKLLALYFYYQAPANILIKLLFVGELFFIYRFFKSIIGQGFLILLWGLLYFSPLAIDRQVIQWRYELMAQSKINNFNIPSGSRFVLFTSNLLVQHSFCKFSEPV